jgi:hypothetical protein
MKLFTALPNSCDPNCMRIFFRVKPKMRAKDEKGDLEEALMLAHAETVGALCVDDTYDLCYEELAEAEQWETESGRAAGAGFQGSVFCSGPICVDS